MFYDNDWLKKRKRYHPHVDQIIQWFINEYGQFKTSLDVGAGDGRYSYNLAKSGTEAYAIDQHDWSLPELPTKTAHCITHDLTKPIIMKKIFDLVLCIEVAEHLPASAADVLCDTLTKHCNGLLLFTAAPPGQTGDGHINCQPKQYWIDRLTERGLMHLPEESEHISKSWKTLLNKKMSWLHKNVMIFEKID